MFNEDFKTKYLEMFSDSKDVVKSAFNNLEKIEVANVFGIVKETLEKKDIFKDTLKYVRNAYTNGSLNEQEYKAYIDEINNIALYRNNIDDYYALRIYGASVEFMTSDERIAPVPKQYINTLIPALILAHLNDPESVKQAYNDFFINKKEEITPLLDQ